MSLFQRPARWRMVTFLQSVDESSGSKPVCDCKISHPPVRNLSFDSDVTEVITPKRARYEASAMNTPIAKKHKAQAVKTRTPAHIKPISPSHAKAAPTGIPQALLEAIAKRRAKVDAEGVVQIVHARQLRTTSVVTPVDSSVAARPELATPIRKAIQARRKSITTAQHKPQFACEASSVHRGLPTPLRLAIHLRRKSFGGASRVACTSAIEDHDRMPLATLTNVDAKPEVSVQLGALKSRLRKAYTMVTESPQPEAKRVTRNSAKQMMIAQAYTVLPNSPCSVNRL
eukprot:TRINITY_DN1141_c0_g1_i2.p1 TRINITY_DN1141_c0_g1~~TRINITY_DN1141_c0_g1_i2.p1  ORF type:complete len:286 (-),score=38.45 TRINITY_DN1141_c0_g1_i2:218-1075(-)